ncbi:MAG: thioredoxin domain-containing protein [Pseudomonadota bacterium]
MKSRWPALLILGAVTTLVAQTALSADTSTLARAAGVAISQADVDARSATRRAAETAAYQVEAHRLEVQHARALRAITNEELEHAIDERVTDREAAELGITRDALLGRVAHPEPDALQMHAFYDARKDQIGAPYEVVQPAIHDHLASEAHGQALHEFYVGLRKKHGAELLLEPARDAIPGSGPARGLAGAAVTVVEFADFQCPYCVNIAPTLSRLLADHPSHVRLEFRQLPLTTLHAEAERAAEASVCADEQQRFWEFHDAVFATQGRFDAGTLIESATKVGVDIKAFRECLTSGRPEKVIKRDTQAADELAIAGTPAIFVNGRFLAGAVSYEQLSAVIKDELHRRGIAVAVSASAAH